MRSWTGRLASLAKNGRTGMSPKHFLRDDSGATYILVASAMTVMMGMAGLGFDATIWYKDKRDMQNVADMAVMNGRHAKLAGGDIDAIKQAAVAGNDAAAVLDLEMPFDGRFQKIAALGNNREYHTE